MDRCTSLAVREEERGWRDARRPAACLSLVVRTLPVFFAAARVAKASASATRSERGERMVNEGGVWNE